MEVRKLGECGLAVESGTSILSRPGGTGGRPSISGMFDCRQFNPHKIRLFKFFCMIMSCTESMVAFKRVVSVALV